MKLPSKLIVLWAVLQVITVSKACKSEKYVNCPDKNADYDEVSKDPNATKAEKCEAMMNEAYCVYADMPKDDPEHYCVLLPENVIKERQEWCPAYCAACLALPSAALTACLTLAAA